VQQTSEEEKKLRRRKCILIFTSFPWQYSQLGNKDMMKTDMNMNATNIRRSKWKYEW
jgi:hypothetical protein